MKISDYIVQFLIDNNVTDIFGYPGVGCGHFMDSLSKSNINSHLVYHEQAAAFAACSYAQASHKPGIAYTTAGPGGTNLITGIANAYCDSIPTVFIVGDKDLTSLRCSYNMRQMASQEIDITSITAPITKWSYQVTRKEEIRFVLEKAFYIAFSERPGPALIDIPSDIQRSDINPENLEAFQHNDRPDYKNYIEMIKTELDKSSKPVILVGNGIKQTGLEDDVMVFAKRNNIPVVTTLVCFDLYSDIENRIGYIGIDGDSAANKIVDKCDLLLSMGARLNFKQVRNNRAKFAPNAQIIRIDCDENELSYILRDELPICADLKYLVPELVKIKLKEKNKTWLYECIESKFQSQRNSVLNADAGEVIKVICDQIPKYTPVAIDTGSHRRWIMSQFQFKKGQRLYQSAGLVSMGYSLPAAIGLYYATKKPVACFNGDGSLMMNIQELQFINRERLPITIIVMNNHCLGDIMEFQKKIFDGNFYNTTEQTGYKAADFELIAKAFHMNYTRITNISNLMNVQFISEMPQLIEVIIPENLE